jgi:hypothetical protein
MFFWVRSLSKLLSICPYVSTQSQSFKTELHQSYTESKHRREPGNLLLTRRHDVTIVRPHTSWLHLPLVPQKPRWLQCGSLVNNWVNFDLTPWKVAKPAVCIMSLCSLIGLLGGRSGIDIPHSFRAAQHNDFYTHSRIIIVGNRSWEKCGLLP